MKKISNKLSLSEQELHVLKFWKDQQIFEKSIEQRPQSNPFIFYDGPPFATGLPHYGHLLSSIIKDAIPRYQTMQGRRVERRFGWDCHGLPVETEIEKTFELGGRPEIERFGIDHFNEECRKIVLRYTSEWRETIDRIGRWVDFDNDYKTMDRSFMESVWWVFAQLWKQGLIYKGLKVVPFSARLSSPLSNFEANLNYKDVQDHSLTVRFAVDGEPDTFFLAWTTTPWTLPSNLALCVGANLQYAKVKNFKDGANYYLSKNRIAEYFEPNSFEVISLHQGTELVGKHYQRLFDFAGHDCGEKAWSVLSDDYVSDDSGSGIVHQAPAFGEDDLRICQQAGICVFDPINSEGYFLEESGQFAGKHFKEADSFIIKELKKQGKVFVHQSLQHSYPFCWRTDSPLMYKAIDTWFVKVEELKEKLLQNNSTINWQPARIKTGRFGKWLENARDWAISRNRFWGTPLPVWKSEDGDYICFGSIQELEETVGQKVDDLHKHFVDQLTFEKDGKTYKRIPEVLDCWFESGAMPYAQEHYPFENKEKFEANFPADFISEGLDQTRGWFYTLMVIATGLFDKPAFKNVIVSGMLLAEDGKKMSKRLKNYPQPELMIQKYGADAVRLYLLNSAAVQAEELRFAERGLVDTMRGILIPLWNAASFLTTYAEIDGWKPEAIDTKSLPENLLDRWILSKLQGLIQHVRLHMDQYQLSESITPLVAFIDLLTNWYIRRSRRRFWKSEQGADKQQAYQTLYQVLSDFSRLIAPFAPFIAENIYQSLRFENDVESVHLTKFPVAQEKYVNHELEERMEWTLLAVRLGRSLRAKHQLKVRQPLSKITLMTRQDNAMESLEKMKDTVAQELNVKQVELSHDEVQLVHLSAKPDFKKLGPQVGQKMGLISKQMKLLPDEMVLELYGGKSITFDLEGEPYEIMPDDAIIQRHEKEGVRVLTENNLTVALEITLDQSLIQEGLAREFVHAIQNIRKELDLDVADRIHIAYETDRDLANAIKSYQNFIQQETLALSVEKSFEAHQEVKINDFSCKVHIQKAFS